MKLNVFVRCQVKSKGFYRNTFYIYYRIISSFISAFCRRAACRKPSYRRSSHSSLTLLLIARRTNVNEWNAKRCLVIAPGLTRHSLGGALISVLLCVRLKIFKNSESTSYTALCLARCSRTGILLLCVTGSRTPTHRRIVLTDLSVYPFISLFVLLDFL